MNPQGTSFIPQRPVQAQVKRRGVRKIYILTYISYVLFFGTVLGAIALFLFNSLLDSRLQNIKDRLVAEESKFDQSAIEQIQLLDSQIKTASARMDLHLSVIPVFEALERNVSQALKFNSFLYTRENDSSPLIEMTGEAIVLGSLVFQRDLLASDPILSGAQFSQVAVASGPSADEDSGALDYNTMETRIGFWLEQALPIDAIKYRAQENAVLVEDQEEFTDTSSDSQNDTGGLEEFGDTQTSDNQN